ncbi:hypothetical protein [Stieleria marina]|uniref:hypothetical protein n=1 Tax=Stieleria marina TaxID=1930275 RepID=UPI003AF3CE05
MEPDLIEVMLYEWFEMLAKALQLEFVEELPLQTPDLYGQPFPRSPECGFVDI